MERIKYTLKNQRYREPTQFAIFFHHIYDMMKKITELNLPKIQTDKGRFIELRVAA
jgi:hypothetical protein